MAIVRRKPAAAQLREHAGFDGNGRIIRSTIVIDNQPTNFVRWLCREIPSKYLAPADVLQVWLGGEKLGQPSEVALKFWAQRQRFSEWPALPTGSPMEASIAHWGASKPVWLADEYRWAKLCDEAEDFHGYESRHAVALRNFSMLEKYLGSKRLSGPRKSLLEAVRESDSRRGRHDAEGLERA